MSLNVPMNEDDRIRLLQQENPYCMCGRAWTPLKLPFGYIRQCPTCTMNVSYCQCDPPKPEPPEHML